MFKNFISLLESKHFYDAIKAHHEHVKNHPELYAANTDKRKKQVEELLAELEFSYTLNADPVFINVQKIKEIEFVVFELFTKSDMHTQISIKQDFVALFDNEDLSIIISDLANNLMKFTFNQLTAKMNEQ